MSMHTNVPDDFSEIHLIPYAHTDFAWTNSRRWHIWRYIYAFKRALELMREDPAYTYVIDNVHHAYRAFEQFCPELLSEFGERVREGRMVIAGGGYALARPNYSGDEAYVRNLIEGRRYFERRFDIPASESYFFFNADTAIGHSQLPQLLTLTGYRYYRANRPSETMNRKGIPRQFRWRGADGSEILVARGDYGGLFITDYFDRYPDMDRDWEHILKEYWAVEERNASNSESDKLMLFFGCDDVIPGCNLVDEPVPYHEFMEAWNRHQRGRLRLSTPGRYFAALEAEREALPAVEGVLDHCELSYNIPFKGKHSMWYRRRILERLILRLEQLYAILAVCGRPQPDEELHALWLDHMGIAGHALEFVLVGDIEALEALGDEAILRCRRLIADAEERIAALSENHSDASAGITQYTVINPLPEAREEIVRLHVTTPFGFDGLILRDSTGAVLPYQVTEAYIADKGYRGAYNAVDVLVRLPLPACGWNTVMASPSEEPLTYAPDETEHMLPTHPLGRDMTPLTLDTGAVRVTFLGGRIIAVEQEGRRITGEFGVLTFSRLHPRSLTWTAIWGDTDECAFEPEAWGIVRSGSQRRIYRMTGRVGRAHATVDVILDTGSPRLDFEVTLDCEPDEGIFTVSFPCDADTEVYADIPYGMEHRDLSSEPSAECQGHAEDPTHYFFWESAWRGQFFARNLALFTRDGVDTALISDTCSMYYSLRRDLGQVSLLLHGMHDNSVPSEHRRDTWIRLGSPSFLGLGKHSFAFSYRPFARADRSTLLHTAAREARLLQNRPSAVSKFGFASANLLPLSVGVLAHDGAPILVTAHYTEGEERIIRGYESSGVGGRVRLTVGGAVATAYKADLLGNRLDGELHVENGAISFDVRAWEIFTLRFTTK